MPPIIRSGGIKNENTHTYVCKLTITIHMVFTYALYRLYTFKSVSLLKVCEYSNITQRLFSSVISAAGKTFTTNPVIPQLLAKIRNTGLSQHVVYNCLPNLS